MESAKFEKIALSPISQTDTNKVTHANAPTLTGF